MTCTSSPQKSRMGRPRARRQPEKARTVLVPQPMADFPRVPRSKADFTALREHVSLVLWETVAATFPDVRLEAEDENEGADRPISTPLLSVRLKALKQIAELYGVGGKKRAKAREVVKAPCATPEEIAESVREWVRAREEQTQAC